MLVVSTASIRKTFKWNIYRNTDRVLHCSYKQ